MTTRTKKISQFDKLNIEGYLFTKQAALELELFRLKEESEKIKKILNMIHSYKHIKNVK
jgi:hypothetical protein